MITIKNKTDDGFSFAETIAALTIMLILTAGVGLGAYKIIESAKKASAKNQIEVFKGALYLYYLDCGSYPNDAQGLDALYTKPIISPVSNSWNGPYVDREIGLDPWGNAFVYTTLNEYNLPFILYSYGADGIKGGDGKNEDIMSWK